MAKQPRNIDWDLGRVYKDPKKPDEIAATNEDVMMALLMDIRGELRKLNKTLTEASIFVNGKVG